MRSKPNCLNTLQAAGFNYEDACALRRISMTLHRWHELECGIAGFIPQSTLSIERDGDEPDSPPFMREQYPTKTGYVDKRWPIADRERGALKRLQAIMARYPGFAYYVQTDPRGCALYIIAKADIPAGASLDSCYNRGIAVFK